MSQYSNIQKVGNSSLATLHQMEYLEISRHQLVAVAPWKIFLVASLCTWTVYLIARSIYRLYLSPLATIPGPKLAALTLWYETYFQLFKGDGGTFFFEVHKWHERYGKSALTSHIQQEAWAHDDRSHHSHWT